MWYGILRGKGDGQKKERCLGQSGKMRLSRCGTEGKDGQSSPFSTSTVPFSLQSEHHKDTDWPKVWKQSKPQQRTLDNQGCMRKAGMTRQGKPTSGTARPIYNGKWSSKGMVQQGERKEGQCHWSRRMSQVPWESWTRVMWKTMRALPEGNRA